MTTDRPYERNDPFRPLPAAFALASALFSITCGSNAPPKTGEGEAAGAGGGTTAEGGTTAGGGTTAEGGQGGAAGEVAPWVCPEPERPNVLYVHGRAGADTQPGTCAEPLRSVSRSLQLVAQTRGIDTVHLFGTPAGAAPMVYSTETTQESFPLRPKKNASGSSLTIEGDARDRVTISGAGLCSSVSSQLCAFELANEGIQVRSLTLKSERGTIVAVRAPDVALRDVDLGDSPENALYVAAGSSATLTVEDALIHDNRLNGIRVPYDSELRQGRVVFNRVVVRKNRRDGVSCGSWHGTSFESTNSEYAENGRRGIFLNQSCALTSSHDTIHDNGEGIVGVYLNSPMRVTNTVIRSNDGSGVSVEPADWYPRGTFVFRSTTLVGNGGFAFTSLAPLSVDFGVPGDAAKPAEPGNNVLQSTTEPNVKGGLCFGSSAAVVSAFSNQWGVCPPTRNADAKCGGAVAISGAGSVDTFDKCQPL